MKENTVHYSIHIKAKKKKEEAVNPVYNVGDQGTQVPGLQAKWVYYTSVSTRYSNHK